MKTAIIALAAGALVAPAALAGSVSGPFTDDIYSSGQFTDSWVAEGRYGNNANNGDWELGVQGFDLQNTNYTWGPSVVDYTAQITYIPTGQVRLEIFALGGGPTALASIENDVPMGGINALALRTAAPRDGVASISNITVFSQSFSESLSVNQPQGPRALSLVFTGFDFADDDGFQVSFDFQWRWTDARGSSPAFQLKAGNFNQRIIPLPGAAGMALAGLGIAASRRRR
jgi:hypothetical protein